MATRKTQPVAAAPVVAKRGPGRPRKVQPEAVTPTQVKAKYDAAGGGKRMRAWNPPSSGPNKAVVGIQKIRDRARDARRNDWTGESGTQKWATNLIGVGIVPRFKRITNKARKLEIIDLWNDFVAKADADNVLNLYGLQTLAVKSWFESGEVFLRRRDRRVDSGLPVPVQMQLIEADFVPMLDSDYWPGMKTGHRIRSGIEFNRISQRVAYWMYREHPGDGTSTINSIDNLVRVPADQVRHIYEPSRPGAIRGVSPMASILTRLRNVGDYDDAVLERQKLANLFMAFIKYTLPNLEGQDRDPLTGMPLEGSLDAPLAALMPGIVQELEPGQEVQFANPPEAGTTYSDYMRTQHMGTSAAMGIPYEIFSGDIKEVSDRTLRVIINEFRRLAEQRQWQIVIPMMCQPCVDWFAEAALLVGKIAVAELDPVRRVEHAPHGWQHIHPVQDPQGKKLEVEAGFRSRSSVIAERGDDPDMVDDERKIDIDREKELGLYQEPPSAGGGGGQTDGGDQDGIDNEEYSAPPNALEQALIARANAEQKLIEARAKREGEPVPAKAISELEQLHLDLTRQIVSLMGTSDAAQ